MAIAAPPQSKSRPAGYNRRTGTLPKAMSQIPGQPDTAEHTTPSRHDNEVNSFPHLTGLTEPLDYQRVPSQTQIPTNPNLEETSYGRIYAHCVN